MPAEPEGVAHLLSLVTAAREAAGRLGPEAQVVRGLLDQAETDLRNLASHAGRPDEGIRPEDLTTENDAGVA